jgi:hypothetical protein
LSRIMHDGLHGDGGMITSSVFVSMQTERTYEHAYANVDALRAQILTSLTGVRFETSEPTIFLLCNFVYHRRSAESVDQFRAKVTQAAVLEPLLDEIFRAYGPRARVRIGNAPLQGANWEAILEETGLAALLARVSAKHGYGTVEACDLRANVQQRNALGWTVHSETREHAGAEIIAFDLGVDSLLEEQDQAASSYRVLDYPAARTRACHGPGKHVYLLNARILEADLLISVPKLKTHEKVGLTAALKGCVGAVAHKDCLAHHRRGAAAAGGDEYPNSRSGLQESVTAFHEWVYAREAAGPGSKLLRVADRVFRKARVLGGAVSHGSWPGNDTAWRMALDLARILRYGRSDGSMREAPQRPHFVLTDGIIGGEGQGPLNVDPVRFGMLAWSDDAVAADVANAAAMRIPLEQLRIVTRAFGIPRYPLTSCSGPADVCILADGRAYTPAAFARDHGRDVRMPRGW